MYKFVKGMNVTKGMYQYRGGIFSPSTDECAQASMGSHAMEVVGYGENEQGVPFWIMKNSWGSGYGVNGGYLHMRRLPTGKAKGPQ
jgi:C1A family cysteine protease